MIYGTVVKGAKILGVMPEQLGDVACLKNLNHPSNDRQENIRLYSEVIDAVEKVK